MTNKKIVCLFCGSFALIQKRNDLKVVVCSNCKRQTELDTYQDMFDRWVDEIRNED